MLLEIAYFLTGGITGISMGSIGVGAGLISMPLLIYSGLTIKEAVAAAMVMQLFPQSIPGVINYWKSIRWVPTILLIIGSVFGIWLGSYLVKHEILTERLMYRLITVFLFVTTIYFYIRHWDE